MIQFCCNVLLMSFLVLALVALTTLHFIEFSAVLKSALPLRAPFELVVSIVWICYPIRVDFCAQKPTKVTSPPGRGIGNGGRKRAGNETNILHDDTGVKCCQNITCSNTGRYSATCTKVSAVYTSGFAWWSTFSHLFPPRSSLTILLVDWQSFLHITSQWCCAVHVLCCSPRGL